VAKIRVRARAVDMLGRQQIAGIPTAIHELFKNAHDAYAEHVQVDYFRADDLFVLRDDGMGMTKEDFETRWLTLGTESKVGANSRDPGWTGPNSELPRPIMGEKGIGRLAIAAICPQVLIVSRAIRQDGLKQSVVALVCWELFEVPGLDLDMIDIPLTELTDAPLPDRAVVKELVARTKSNIETLKIPPSDKARLVASLEAFDFSPSELSERLGAPSLARDGHGTQFYIRPANTILADDIDTAADDLASPLEKMLLGFSNTMMPDRPEPVIVAEFCDHKEDGTTDELIGGNSFFTPDEFLSADHHIDGQFDEYGQFEGTISVYSKEPVRHLVQWQKGNGRKTDCGPFRIKFAYVQGLPNQTLLPPADWAQISSKLNRIGGLYVYRDGIRILPYGNSDFDFLNIERRRTKSAQDWFFSYRRIFGAIEITHSENSDLVEKAGREGFRANKAYREFTDILERFFERLALDFFRPTATFGHDFNATKEQLISDAALLAKREQSTRVKRKAFTQSIEDFFVGLERAKPSAGAEKIISTLRENVMAAELIEQPDRSSQKLLEAEVGARKAADSLVDTFTLQKPRGVGLSKNQQRDWTAYIANRAKLQSEVFGPLYVEIDQIVSDASVNLAGSLDRRRRITASLEAKRKTAANLTSRLRREVQAQVEGLQQEVTDALKSSITQLTADIEETFVELGRTDTSETSEEGLRGLQQRWEGRVEETTNNAREMLESLRDQLQTVVVAVREQDMLDATTAALESEAEGLRDQLNNYVELAQVGMALGIVQHEFGNTVRSIRTAIRKLKPWAAGTPELKGLERELRTGFDHLDTYLSLFTPMSRRLNREPVSLSGEEVRKYIDEVFGDRIRRHSVRVISTTSFDRKSVTGFASTFLPSFVNLVDNAIYWLGTTPDSDEKWIKLDADESGFLVSNSGPPIDPRLAERIFEFGETSKPGGRGMGLYLSREALRKEGFDLILERSGPNSSPVFRIASAVGNGERTQ
jgi:signal transduction histidine kinase